MSSFLPCQTVDASYFLLFAPLIEIIPAGESLCVNLISFCASQIRIGPIEGLRLREEGLDHRSMIAILDGIRISNTGLIPAQRRTALIKIGSSKGTYVRRLDRFNPRLPNDGYRSSHRILLMVCHTNHLDGVLPNYVHRLGTANLHQKTSHSPTPKPRINTTLTLELIFQVPALSSQHNQATSNFRARNHLQYPRSRHITKGSRRWLSP
jgi:hypothetical protein